MLDKIILVDGIIQNDTINGLRVNVDLIEPKGNRNVRLMIPLTEENGCTIHNTGNYSPSAGDEMHQQYFQNVEDYEQGYVGAHIFIDYDSLTQIAPINEKMYHAGDGKNGIGNTTTWALEICVNKNIFIAHDNAEMFLASYLYTFKDKNLYGHINWSGKKCPEWIIDNIGLKEFINNVNTIVEKTVEEDDKDKPSSWAKEAWDWGIKNGITKGKRPKDDITRQEVVQMLYNKEKNK